MQARSPRRRPVPIVLCLGTTALVIGNMALAATFPQPPARPGVTGPSVQWLLERHPVVRWAAAHSGHRWP
ncbi:hypothetical protein KPATCC21470_0787 [Kitasatospora purpeofusca]